MRVASVVGARPQFIKSAPVSQALRDAGHEEYLIHTGQHYDYGMSDIFFDQMKLPRPNVNLGVGSGSPGMQLGLMVMGLEDILEKHDPDCVLVYGDTTSTLAAALVARKMDLLLAHVEAGLRSFSRAMPEEHNRVLTDHCSDILLCPTETALKNLEAENITEGVYLTGDVMVDAIRIFEERLGQGRLDEFGLCQDEYVLATIHRPSNADDLATLEGILSALDRLSLRVVLPVHPRTRKGIDSIGGDFTNVQLIEPVGYLDMLLLERGARVIATDSGGIQKEAYVLGVPCVTIRNETEWTETLVDGWNVLVGNDPRRIVQAIEEKAGLVPGRTRGDVFGDGMAAQKIARVLSNWP